MKQYTYLVLLFLSAIFNGYAVENELLDFRQSADFLVIEYMSLQNGESFGQEPLVYTVSEADYFYQINQGGNDQAIQVTIDFTAFEGADTAYIYLSDDSKLNYYPMAVLKSLSLSLKSFEATNTVNAVLRDDQGRDYTIPLGNLMFWDWRILSWWNPGYISDFQKYEESNTPLGNVALRGILISRDSEVQNRSLEIELKNAVALYDAVQ